MKKYLNLLANKYKMLFSFEQSNHIKLTNKQSKAKRIYLYQKRLI